MDTDLACFVAGDAAVLSVEHPLFHQPLNEQIHAGISAQTTTSIYMYVHTSGRINS